MERRKILRALAVGIAVPAAGCAEDDGPDDEDSGTVSGEPGDQESESGDADENDDSDDSGDDSGGLEIVEHEFYEEDFEAGVEGTVENTGDESIDYVEVRVEFYDDEGVRIEDGIDNTEDLDGGEQWRFDVVYLGDDPEAVEDYDIEVSDSPF